MFISIGLISSSDKEDAASLWRKKAVNLFPSSAKIVIWSGCDLSEACLEHRSLVHVGAHTRSLRVKSSLSRILPHIKPKTSASRRNSPNCLWLISFQQVFKDGVMDLFLREAADRIGVDDVLAQIDARMDWRAFLPILKRRLARSGTVWPGLAAWLRPTGPFRLPADRERRFRGEHCFDRMKRLFGLHRAGD